MEKLSISGRFYQNGQENPHRLQKKFSSDHKISRTVTEVNKALANWTKEYHMEAVRALRDMGKYRLSVSHNQFFVSPTTWDRWSSESRQQHDTTFLAFILSQSQQYKKPAAAGHEKGVQRKRRAHLSMGFQLVVEAIPWWILRRFPQSNYVNQLLILKNEWYTQSRQPWTC